MPLDLAQLEQMVSWLDEERRKDRDELARFRQRVEQQAQVGVEQMQRFQELDSRVSAVQTQLARITLLEQSMEQLRKELVALVEQVDQKTVAVLRESDRTRLIEREAQTHALSELRKQIEILPQMEEALAARQTEEQRLNQLILEQRSKLLAIQDRVDERVHAIRVLEEQRAHDVKRIAQLQETSTELLRRTEAYSAKAQLLEDGLRKAEQQVAALQGARDTLRVEQRDFMEEQRVAEQQRKRQLDDWAKELVQSQKKIAEFSTTMQVYKDFYDKNRHALESLETLQTHLSQRQAELAEMQRLSDERTKKQLLEWREENEKRSKQVALETEYAWNEQLRSNEALDKRLDQVESALPVVDSDIALLWEEINKTGESQLECLHKRQADLDEILTTRKKKAASSKSPKNPKS
jgi:DNA repair exonuclease SbcCD ATPase subunit